MYNIDQLKTKLETLEFKKYELENSLMEINKSLSYNKQEIFILKGNYRITKTRLKNLNLFEELKQCEEEETKELNIINKVIEDLNNQKEELNKDFVNVNEEIKTLKEEIKKSL